MRAYLQLVRLPNVFTAMADILLGFLLTHRTLEPAGRFALLLAASSLLYMSGMVLNDYFDREQDARERPFRPIPSGRVSATTALTLGFVLLVGGARAGLGRDGRVRRRAPRRGGHAVGRRVLVYDGVVKQTPLAPVVMGGCRTLNVLLGMSLSFQPWSPAYAAVAGGIGLYIVGVTTFARSEARDSGRWQLSLGLAVLLAGLAVVASTPRWATGGEWPAIRVQANWYVFWGLLGLLIGYRCLRAVLDPRPALVQVAVRNCIFSLVIIDAAACLAAQEMFWGVLILLLLVPMLLAGRWIYST